MQPFQHLFPAAAAYQVLGGEVHQQLQQGPQVLILLRATLTLQAGAGIEGHL